MNFRSKDEYRLYFADCKKYVKITNICKLVNISIGNYSNFMKGYDTLSYNKLADLERAISDTLKKYV